jgi:hypothetical protein
LPEFRADFNRRFAVQPRSEMDAHRSLNDQDDLDQILTWHETRTLSKNLTLQFRKTVYQIKTPRPSYAMRNAAVTVCLDAQDQLAIFYKGRSLDYTIFHQQSKQSEIVDTKQLNAVIRSPHKPAPDHPWRQGFVTPLSQKRSVSSSKGDIL